ncbi:MAG: SH3 domain-containing protein [Microcoleus sp.]
MKKHEMWQKYTSLTSSLLVTATALVAPSFAANKSPTPYKVEVQNQGESLLAQIPDSCRQVVAGNGLNVRQEPTTDSKAIGIIGSGRNVTIQSLGENGWVPITAPLKGYVYGGFLGECKAANSPPPTDCRLVAALRGINVYQTPSTDGETTGFVANGRRVTIESLGTDGWVPITVPLRGYVQSENLAYCR